MRARLDNLQTELEQADQSVTTLQHDKAELQARLQHAADELEHVKVKLCHPSLCSSHRQAGSKIQAVDACEERGVKKTLQHS